MKTIDPDDLLFQFAKEIKAVMPDYIKVGMIAYATEIVGVLPLDSQSSEWSGIEFTYGGYSNIGAAIMQAVGLFSNDTVQKRIVLLSDGELSMPDKESEQALTAFHNALRLLDSEKVSVDIIQLGEEIPEESNILPELTGYEAKRYRLQDASQLPGIAKDYILEVAGFFPLSVGRITGKDAQIPITLPDNSMEKAVIFLLGRMPEVAVNVSNQAGNIEIEQGRGYSVITLDRPADREIELTVSSPEDIDASVYLSAAYRVEMASTAGYDVEQGTAHIQVDILTADKDSLLAGHLSAGKDVPLFINEEPVSAQIQNGKLCTEYPMDPMLFPAGASYELTVAVGLPETFGIYYGSVASTVSVEIPPVVEEEPGPDWFLISVVVILVLSLCAILILMNRKKKYRPRGSRSVDFPVTEGEGHERSKYDFCGKLSIYVLQNPDGIEYPPAGINLFASCHKSTVTLSFLLEACRLPLMVKETDKIIFKPGPGKSLLVKNNSKATAVKGREVLLKSKQYELHFHEKVNLIFEDTDSNEKRITELEIHYKDIKA